jgi:hypothetical protein
LTKFTQLTFGFFLPTLSFTMPILPHLPKSKKPKHLSSSVARADTPVYGVELAADDLKSLRELPADANVMIVSVGDYPKLKLPRSKTKGFWRMRLVEAKGNWKTDKISPKIKESAFQPGARARALLRGAEAIAEDLKAAGGTFDLEAVCSLTRLTRQAIHKQVTDGRLLAVPGPSNRNVYPVAQFNNDGRPVEGLKEARDALGSRSPWMLLNFLVNPEARLDNRKPIDLLRAGNLDVVVEAARRVGIQGA